jgi:hypothetical protein
MGACAGMEPTTCIISSTPLSSSSALPTKRLPPSSSSASPSRRSCPALVEAGAWGATQRLESSVSACLWMRPVSSIMSSSPPPSFEDAADACGSASSARWSCPVLVEVGAWRPTPRLGGGLSKLPEFEESDIEDSWARRSMRSAGSDKGDGDEKSGDRYAGLASMRGKIVGRRGTVQSSASVADITSPTKKLQQPSVLTG